MGHTSFDSSCSVLVSVFLSPACGSAKDTHMAACRAQNMYLTLYTCLAPAWFFSE